MIAQGVVTFGDGEFHWTSESVAINSTVAPVGSNAAGFAVASGPVAAVVASSAGATWRLGPGEAVFRPAATTKQRHGGGGRCRLAHHDQHRRRFRQWGLRSREPVREDVDLVRAQMPPSSSLTVHAEVSALVFVTTGQVTTGDTTIVSAGTTAIRDGDVTLANDGAEAATVLVATIGRAVGRAGSRAGSRCGAAGE